MNETLDIVANAPLGKMADQKKWTFLESRFRFFLQIGGIPNGILLTILGESGGGKSTLARRIAVDLSSQIRILLWLSEETRQNYESEYANEICANRSNMIYLSEMDLQKETVDKLDTVDRCIEYFKMIIIRSRAKLVIFDNITTSILYDSRHVMAQASIIRGINKIAIELDITIILLVHTKKGASKNIISKDDVRGSAQSCQMAHLFLTLHRTNIGKRIRNFVRIEKCRHWHCDDNLFELNYMERSYRSDKVTDFQELKSAYKSRDQ